MKKAKAPRVPVLETAFEVNLPKLMRAAKAAASSRLVLDDGDVRTVAVLAETRLTIFLGGRQWAVDIVPVQCLEGRVRPLLKCPRAHEGKFQSLYFRDDELACRKCHGLRYQSNLAAGQTDRARLKKYRFEQKLQKYNILPTLKRTYRGWRARHLRLLQNYEILRQVGAFHNSPPK